MKTASTTLVILLLSLAAVCPSRTLLAEAGPADDSVKVNNGENRVKDVEEDDILRRCRSALCAMDDNMVYKTRRCHVKMTVKLPDTVHVKELEMVGKGYYTQLTRVIKPPSSRGTKFLSQRVKGRKILYSFFPGSSRVIRVSGHMLRQSVLGSDLSYEDLMDAPRLDDDYDVVRGESIVIDGEKYYRMELKAKRRSVTYPRRVVIIEKRRKVPLKQEYYSRGNKLIKVQTFSNVKRINDRDYPMKIVMKNLLRKNTITTLEIFNLQFDVRLPHRLFTRRYLEREW